ncbi:MAG: hypothetical protein LBI16_01360 [Burkholderiales bacterium]|jgi:Tfp pilus assembly protein FimT|nr:hypothetical protein [Burkholderiales bacterium]
MKADNNIHGFLLTELMIVVALLVLFLAMSVPSIQAYLEISKVRNVPESIEKGMQIARFNALKTNHLTQFVLTTAVVNGAAVINGWAVREEIPAIPALDESIAQIAVPAAPGWRERSRCGLKLTVLVAQGCATSIFPRRISKDAEIGQQRERV